MNAVGDRSYRDLVFHKIGPNNLPHTSGHTAMQVTHGIPPAAHSQGEDRHVEGVAETAQFHELLPGDSKIIPEAGEMLFHHVKRKCIMSRRNRCMSREETCRANLLCSFFECHPLLNEFARPLEQHECRVTFVCVEYSGLDS